MSTVFVILGNKLKQNSKMTNILKSRLDKGIEKYKKNDVIIVCGGNTANEMHTEAYVMKKYLVSVGNIPESSIIKESRSISTHENLIFLSNILFKKKIHTFSLITSKTHIPKVKKLVKKLKLNEDYIINYISVA